MSDVDECYDESSNFEKTHPKKKDKKFKSDSPEKFKEKPLSIHEIKKMQKEEREKEEKEKIEKEKEEKEKEELEGKDEDEEQEENIENESTCPTVHITQKNNNFLNEKLCIISPFTL